MRLFSSTIIKSSDISDKNLALHYADNRNRLLAAERIHSSIFDLEQSVWQY